MELTEVRINLCKDGNGGRLRAYCALTFDDTFVIRDVKLIEGQDGLFLAMPSRKICDRCPACGEKNHLKARYCNNCGRRLDESRPLRHHDSGELSRVKLYADIAHPIHAQCRQALERRVLLAYQEELNRSKLPGYVAPRMEGGDLEYYELPAPPPMGLPRQTHYSVAGS